jgi:hypothetical protein
MELQSSIMRLMGAEQGTFAYEPMQRASYGVTPHVARMLLATCTLHWPDSQECGSVIMGAIVLVPKRSSTAPASVRETNGCC